MAKIKVNISYTLDIPYQYFPDYMSVEQIKEKFIESHIMKIEKSTIGKYEPDIDINDK